MKSALSLAAWRDRVNVALNAQDPAGFLNLAAALEADGRSGCLRLAVRLRRELLVREKERWRLQQGYAFERKFWLSGLPVAGVDEAGRGPLAGPVVAAAVVLPQGILVPGLRDSKEVPAGKRRLLSGVIRAKAVAVGVGLVGPLAIERLGIVAATKKAMVMALRRSGFSAGTVLVDALDLPGMPWKIVPIIHGDRLSNSIAAASIIAKVTRDGIMEGLDRRFPGYGFARHKGYGTEEHREALLRHGLSPIHRSSFVRTFLDRETGNVMCCQEL